ncbi:helicase-associated domain-containing protein [Corynebacterium sp. P7202]|uniref:Helicase-associated domain-containing protein n=1 Tax=Corynebacterium pygosceleis TaxID=2800406 RepID=A0A9Q4GL69_9CORY|nr:helicase-associated domain-containing protein [Corynebacterium pygosceleis]MCK7638191.1 helicase-associated domain-containing protein [Corynebacterium pygosceleis]MCX7444254.1 helicase-associated domain-containing protein [Corynebacterium pygosceleis]MCX7468907.1 helicase-associated domain-containing protein [Corynebacterium pygosceleis]
MKKSAAAPDTGPTFRQWLSGVDDDRLSRIIDHRPDTAWPLPPGIGALAARLQLRASVARSTAELNALQLVVLEAAAALGGELHPVTAPDVVELVTERLNSTEGTAALDPEVVNRTLDELMDRALVYGNADRLRVTTEAMSSLPANWQLLPDPGGRSAQLDGDTARTRIEGLSPRERRILDTLVSSGGFGLSKDAAPDADPERPVPKLIAAGLLLRVDNRTVKMPATVRGILDGTGVAPQPLLPSPRCAGDPALTADPAAQRRVDDEGTASGLEVTRLMRRLITVLGDRPVPCLKEGGIGVRALTKLTRDLDCDDTTVNRLICLGISAGLLGRGEPDPAPANDPGGDLLAPTVDADTWLAKGLASRWAVLLEGWSRSTWAHWRVGRTDTRGRPIHLLSSATEHPGLPDIRALVVDQFARPPEGTPLGRTELDEDLRFTAPVPVSRIRPGTVDDIVDEAAWIGALAHDTATTPLRALRQRPAPRDSPGPELLAAVESVTPPPVDTLIAQGDMTVLAPGPLEPELESELALTADIESSGLASVYRITEGSIRRALDAGRGGTDIHSLLERHTLGELPQNISYLISDVSRRHGTLRGGPALCYLRCDDEALLLQVSQSPGAQKVALRLIAPTVAVAQAPLVQVIDALRADGFQPVAESATGASLDLRERPSRVAAEPDASRPSTPADPARTREVVAAVRRGEAAQDAARNGRTATDNTGRAVQGARTLGVLQAAARANRTVTLGFVDGHGQAGYRRVTPVMVSGGQVDAVDETTGETRGFLLHRITEVILDDD